MTEMVKNIKRQKKESTAGEARLSLASFSEDSYRSYVTIYEETVGRTYVVPSCLESHQPH